MVRRDASQATDTPIPVISILYQDDAICVVNKPAGLPVHRGWAVAERYVLDLVRDQIGMRVYPVHRLDQPTSGVLLFALSPEMASALGKTWMAGQVAKRYLAFTRGIVPAHLDLKHRVKDDEGVLRDARTEFWRLWVFRRRYSLVRCEPHTGRTHQIRRHLKHLSSPIIGDTSYGKSEHNRLFASEFGLNRLALHAYELSFIHPVSEQPFTVKAPLPPEMEQAFVAMGAPLETLFREFPALELPGPGVSDAADH